MRIYSGLDHNAMSTEPDFGVLLTPMFLGRASKRSRTMVRDEARTGGSCLLEESLTCKLPLSLPQCEVSFISACECLPKWNSRREEEKLHIGVGSSQEDCLVGRHSAMLDPERGRNTHISAGGEIQSQQQSSTYAPDTLHNST